MTAARKKALLLTLGGALLVKLVLLFIVLPAVSSHLGSLYGQNHFADDYDKIALNLAQGNGYRFFPDTTETLMREPGYPLFLAAVFTAFGYGLDAAKLANILLGLATAALLAQIALKLSARSAVMVLAPLLFLFHPGVVLAESRGGYEMLFVFTLAVFFLALFRAMTRNRASDYALAGAALGFAVLVKSTPILFPLFIFGYLLWSAPRAAVPSASRVGLMVAAMVVVLSPWIYRNYTLVEKFVPTASVLGVSAHAGQYICENMGSDRRLQDLDAQAAEERGALARTQGYRFRHAYYQHFYTPRDELAFNNGLRDSVFARYFASPLLWAKCGTYNVFNFWFAGKSWSATGLNAIIQLPYLLFAGLGLFFAVREERRFLAGAVALFIGYYMLVHLPILAQARYSVPLIPLLSIFAAIAIQRLAASHFGAARIAGTST